MSVSYTHLDVYKRQVSDSAEDIARKTDTITYEVLCGVSRRVPRVYLEHGTTAAVEDWILND